MLRVDAEQATDTPPELKGGCGEGSHVNTGDKILGHIPMFSLQRWVKLVFFFSLKTRFKSCISALN